MIGLIVDLFLTWWCWKLAEDFFESGHTTLGWMGIVLSAANFASAATIVF
jgi:TRAP-type C4-dicarboxylate transport system permease small subunit